MDNVAVALQIIIALGIANVWILRADRSTPYRPEGASSLAEEFTRYGLPDWVRRAVGITKLALAAALVAGIYFSSLATTAAVLMALLMVAAVIAHIRIRDPWTKALPASLMLFMSTAVAVIHSL
ncbi:MAG: DoxX family protein [Longimicrobiales bacterium]|nr:DoxX family protein [Longimicrobiales bacterium]